MTELKPLVFVNGLPLKETADYDFEKLNDKSIFFNFFKDGWRIRVTPSILINGIPSITFNGQKLDFNDYVIESYQDESKPGVTVWFKGLPIRSLGLIPRVLNEEEEKAYKLEAMHAARSKYQKEHGDLF